MQKTLIKSTKLNKKVKHSSKLTHSSRRSFLKSFPLKKLTHSVSTPTFTNKSIPTITKRSMATQPDTSKLAIYTNAVIHLPKDEHKRTIFFLHGLGDEGASFSDVFEMLNLKNTKVILPNAPKIPITCNGGWIMPGWYDIAHLGDSREFGKSEDVVGINYTVEQLIAGIDLEAKIVGYENIVIGGFSQGSAVAQLTAARLQHKIAGVIALSGYALLTTEPEDKNPINTKDTPYFIYHGKNDQVVTLDYAQKSKAYWESRGLTSIQYQEEPMLGHSLSNKEIAAVKKFLTDIKFD